MLVKIPFVNLFQGLFLVQNRSFHKKHVKWHHTGNVRWFNVSILYSHSKSLYLRSKGCWRNQFGFLETFWMIVVVQIGQHPGDSEWILWESSKVSYGDSQREPPWDSRMTRLGFRRIPFVIAKSSFIKF